MKIILCGRPGCRGCPTIDVNTKTATIKNDAGEKVVMSIKKFDNLKNRIKAGEFD